MAGDRISTAPPVAHEHILGLSKLTRLLRLFARRFTVQERIGRQLADTLERQEFLPALRHPASLASVRRNASYLFVCYQFHRSITDASDILP